MTPEGLSPLEVSSVPCRSDRKPEGMTDLTRSKHSTKVNGTRPERSTKSDGVRP